MNFELRNILPLAFVVLLLGGFIWSILRARKRETIVIDENGRGIRSGLGGWLILVGIGIVLSPIAVIAEVPRTYLPIFEDGTYELLTTPGTEFYHPFWSILIWGEILGNAIIFALGVYLIYLFFGKNRLFPKIYIWALLGSFVFILADAALVKMMVPEIPLLDPETIQQVARGFFAAAIWVPYMLVSKRVSATFVR